MPNRDYIPPPPDPYPNQTEHELIAEFFEVEPESEEAQQCFKRYQNLFYHFNLSPHYENSKLRLILALAKAWFPNFTDLNQFEFPNLVGKPNTHLQVVENGGYYGQLYLDWAEKKRTGKYQSDVEILKEIKSKRTAYQEKKPTALQNDLKKAKAIVKAIGDPTNPKYRAAYEVHEAQFAFAEVDIDKLLEQFKKSTEAGQQTASEKIDLTT